MNDVTQSNPSSVSAPFKVGNFEQGKMVGTVSSQWFSRPDDQKFLDLSSLEAAVKRHADESFADIIDVRDIEVHARDEDNLSLVVPTVSRRAQAVNDRVEVQPTHWSFGQLSSLLGVPAGYLRKLPAQISGINVQYALSNFRSELVKTYVSQNGHHELRAATGPEYGRIFDWQVVEAVRRIAGNGTGEDGYRWKVPGVLNWRTYEYDPNAPITRQSTTLFASDRDVFLFLVDDRNPIEIGKLPNGDPDLIFRGFYVWNSEVGSKSFGIATFYLRAACQNRCLWGVEGFQEIKFRHSKNAPSRFLAEARPALESFADSNTGAVLKGIENARRAIVAQNNDEALQFLGRQKFSKADSRKIVETVLKEEGRPARSIWDFVQGITAVARDSGHQDDRIAVERVAGRLLDKV